MSYKELDDLKKSLDEVTKKLEFEQKKLDIQKDNIVRANKRIKDLKPSLFKKLFGG